MLKEVEERELEEIKARLKKIRHRLKLTLCLSLTFCIFIAMFILVDTLAHKPMQAIFHFLVYIFWAYNFKQAWEIL